MQTCGCEFVVSMWNVLGAYRLAHRAKGKDVRLRQYNSILSSQHLCYVMLSLASRLKGGRKTSMWQTEAVLGMAERQGIMPHSCYVGNSGPLS